jgi:two-component system response regulator YesN
MLKGHTTPYEETLVQEAIDYIHSHYTEKISAEGLVFGKKIDLKVFRPLFQQMTGYKVHDYLVKVRLDKAADDLADFSFNIAEIAYRNGFRSANNFCKVFKEKKGTSPTDYRFQLMTKSSRNGATNSPEMRSNPLESAKRVC